VKLSVSGEGMQGKPGVAAKVFKCLWDADVRILNISTSEIKICMLIPRRDADRAYQALLDGFEIV
jgi:aspartate kinase